MSWRENMEQLPENLWKKLRKMKLKQWGILFLTGLLLTVLSLPVSEKEKKTDSAAGSFSKEGENSLEISAEFIEKTELEKRLEQVLSSVYGIGRVQALIMTEEKREDPFSSGVLRVTGVLIVAEGADNPVTVQNIKDAVQSLFQTEAHRIRIMKMK